jgi:hypothetical protein
MKTILISIAAGSLFTALALAQTPQYTVTDLGALGPFLTASLTPLPTMAWSVAQQYFLAPQSTPSSFTRDRKATSPHPD